MNTIIIKQELRILLLCWLPSLCWWHVTLYISFVPKLLTCYSTLIAKLKLLNMV